MNDELWVLRTAIIKIVQVGFHRFEPRPTFTILKEQRLKKSGIQQKGTLYLFAVEPRRQDAEFSVSLTGSSRSRQNKKTPVGVFCFGGDNRARTCDPLLVRQVLSQLSYTPISDIHYITSFLFVKNNFEQCIKSFFVTRKVEPAYKRLHSRSGMVLADGGGFGAMPRFCVTSALEYGLLLFGE